MRRRLNKAAAVKVAERQIVKVVGAKAKKPGPKIVKRTAKAKAKTRVTTRPKVRALTAKLPQFIVSIVDGSGAEKTRLGPYLSRRSAQVDAKRALLAIASAAKLGSVSTIRAPKLRMQHSTYRPRGGVTAKSGAGREFGRYSRWRVSGDDGYEVGAGATQRTAVILVREHAEIRLNRGGGEAKRSNTAKTRTRYVIQLKAGTGWIDIEDYADQLTADYATHLRHRTHGGTYRVVKRRRTNTRRTAKRKLNPRQISTAIVTAWRHGEAKKIDNTRTDGTSIYLYGTAIARRSGNRIAVTTGGHNTSTTRERLNAIPGVKVAMRAKRLMLNGAAWNGAWTEV